MIKFFRHIRQNLLTQNKFSTYMLYALGEIILVVIGILIALQINTWNEHQKTGALAESYLADIKKDLITDTLTFHTAIKRVRSTISKNKALLNPEFVDGLSTDSIFALLRTSFHSIRIYHIDNATYLKLSNTGFLESGFFNALFTAINNYYNKEYVAYSEYIEWDEEQSIDIFHSDFLGTYKNIDLASLAPENESISIALKEKKDETSFRAFISSPKFRNATWANYNRKEAVLARLLLQQQLATTLIEKIEAELKNK
jgi:hypothetical protein